MSSPLTAKEIDTALAGLRGWALKDDALDKVFKFDSFKDALAFLVRAGLEAEALNHHPDWRNVYNRVFVRLNTHDIGGKVTAKDVELAQRMDRAAGGK